MMIYFAQNLKFLRKKAGKTQDALSSEVNIGRTTIANYESGVSEPSLETLSTFAKYFDITVDQILSNNLEKDGLTLVKNQGYDAKVVAIHNPNLGVPQVVTVDSSGEDNILYVPVKARAGYLLGYGDPEYMETLPTFRLPGLNNATYRMFEVEGVSMAPNILHADRIIGEWVDTLDDIRDNRVHIVVHRGGITVKRVLNRIKERGKIYLKSDTVLHRHDYPTLEINPEDVIEIWYGRLRISSDFSEPAEVYHRLADLELDILEMKKKLSEESGI
jgi:transcriptional regulator with XRE-family HTH domain